MVTFLRNKRSQETGVRIETINRLVSNKKKGLKIPNSGFFLFFFSLKRPDGACQFNIRALNESFASPESFSAAVTL